MYRASTPIPAMINTTCSTILNMDTIFFTMRRNSLFDILNSSFLFVQKILLTEGAILLEVTLPGGTDFVFREALHNLLTQEGISCQAVEELRLLYPTLALSQRLEMGATCQEPLEVETFADVRLAEVEAVAQLILLQGMGGRLTMLGSELKRTLHLGMPQELEGIIGSASDADIGGFEEAKAGIQTDGMVRT